jgi:hypothetical protein
MERPVDVDLRLENRPIRFLIVLAARLFWNETRKRLRPGTRRILTTPTAVSRLRMPWPAVLLGSLLLAIDAPDWAVRRRRRGMRGSMFVLDMDMAMKKDSCEVWLA